MTPLKKTVLLIEDNEDDIELTLIAFRKSDLNTQIVVIKDGQQALDYLFAKGMFASRNIEDVPNLTLLDVNLPKLNGFEVLKEIRGNKVTQFAPVVMLTTSDEHQDIAAGYQLGSNSYIRKPVNFNAFSAVINDLGKYWLQINIPPPH